MRVLDLYAGLGGTDRGIRKVAAEKNIEIDYYAIEIDPIVCQAHKKNNPESNIICANAEDWFDKVTEFDFVWASPPCQSHSRLNKTNEGRGLETRLIDWSLWSLIDILSRQQVKYVVENVKPYYACPFKPNFSLDRHYFWTNLRLVPFKYQKKPNKKWQNIEVKDWLIYHQLEPGKSKHYDKRQQLRNCVHWSIAAGIFEQFLEPKILGLNHFLKELLGAESET